MKLTNGEIYFGKESLDKLAQMPFPVKTAYQIAKMVRKITELYQDISQVKDGLVKKYGTLDEKTQNWTVDQSCPKWNEFATDFNELMDQENEIPLNKIVIPPDVTVQIEPAVLVALEKVVTL